LLGLPALTLVFCLFLLEAKGPYWLGSNFDPDYPYLLNAVIVLQDRAPGHTDHPGTFVQELAAAVILVAHVFRGKGPLVEDVIRQPEMYLWATNVVMLALLAGALVVAGFLTRSVLGAAAALLVVSSVAVSETLLMHAVCVKPEPVLMSLTLALVAMLMSRLTRGSGALGRWEAPLMGVFVGLALASKITALPLAILPLVVLPAWRARLVFSGTALLTLAGALIPVRSRIMEFVFFAGRIATHSGHYGEGPTSLLDGPAYLRSIWRLLVSQSVFSTTLVVGAAIVLLDSRWRETKASDALRSGLRRALTAVLATQAGGVLFVARHPADHYLTPVLALSGASLALSVALALSRLEGAKRRALIGLVVAAGTIGFGVRTWPGLVRELRSTRDAQLSVVTHVEQYLPHGNPIYYYRASSPAYALRFGNDFARNWFAEPIRARFPHALYLNIWEMSLQFMPGYRPLQAGGETPVFFLQGTPLNPQQIARLSDSPSFPFLLQAVPVFQSAFEAVYQLRPRPGALQP
jgi:hypothetical protein